MSDDLVKVTVSDGKYTFIQRKDGSCAALRYGEPWRDDIFDGLMLGMAHRIEELEAKLAKAVDVAEKAIKWLRIYGADVHMEAATLAELKGEQP